MSRRHVVAFALCLVLAAGVVAAQTIPNWPAPASWTPPKTSGGIGTVHAMGDVTFPMPFVGVTPCRIVDTRGAAGTFGGPKLVAGAPRNFPLPTGPCTGLPSGVAAYSLNITAVSALGSGFILIYPQGGAAPVVSTLNYNAGQTVANAAIVPAGTAGGVTVIAGVSGTDLLIDINGYYTSDYNGNINSSEYFGITGSWSGGGVIFGYNTYTGKGYGGNFSDVGTANGSAGVHGANNATPASGTVAGVWGEAAHGDGVYGTNGDGSGAGVHGVLAASVSFSAAVRGQHTATGTEGIGVYGSHAGAGWGVYGVSAGTTGSGARGVYGTASSTTNGTAGVYGSAVGATGATYGVYGSSSSTSPNAAGVKGTDSTGSPTTSTDAPAGVWGDSTTSFGVLGRSRTFAVCGKLYGPSGVYVTEGLLGTTFGTAADTTVGPWAVFAHGNFGASGAKHFVEPHAADPNKVILYSSLEGREVGTYFRGTAQVVNHQAVIEVPEDFRIVTDEEGLTVQLTPVGSFASMYIESQGLNQIVVRSSKDVTFHYLVQGVRRAFKDFQPVAIGHEFMPLTPDDTIPAYLTQEAKRRLIANGTYNADGTVNMTTAERAGWTKIWADRKAEAEVAAKQAQESALATQSQQQQ